jgi:anti-sigma factor RsiW
MLHRHVDSELARALEGDLSAEAARRVEQHIARCERCHAERDRIASGLALARELSPAALPEERADLIRRALKTTPARRRRRLRWLVPATALLVVALSAMLWSLSRAPRLRTAPPDEPPSSLEQLALGLHERGMAASPDTLVTDSVSEARAWALERTGLSVNLAVVRPAEDEGHFALQGAQAVGYRGSTALAVWYAVDGRHVTLATARAQDVPDHVAAWTLAAKSVRRRVVGGSTLLSWTSSGQSYVLASDLPAPGLRACLLCHTQPARRRVIDRLAK